MPASMQVAPQALPRRTRRRVAIAPDALAHVEARFDSLPAGSRWCGYATHHRPHLAGLTLFACGRDQVCLGLVRYDDGVYELMDEDGETITRGHALDQILDRIERA